MKKFLMLLFGLISYLIFFVTFLYSIGFVGNLMVPKSIDFGESGSSSPVLINIILLSFFALQHSIMARPSFKKWWATLFNPVIERSIYVLLSSGALILLFWKWQPITERVWNIEGVLYVLIIQWIFWAGWLIVLISTFLINHFHLFGLLQVFENFKNKSLSSPKFKNNLFYKVVRHPIMLGFVLSFWATPKMTYGHFLFAVITTLYIFIAVKYFEERDLMKIHGEEYIAYQKRTPMIIPFIKFKK